METEINYVLNQHITCTKKELLEVESHIKARTHLVSPGEPCEFSWLYGLEEWCLLSKGRQNFASACMSYSVRAGRLPFNIATGIRTKKYPLLYKSNNNLKEG